MLGIVVCLLAKIQPGEQGNIWDQQENQYGRVIENVLGKSRAKLILTLLLRQGVHHFGIHAYQVKYQEIDRCCPKQELHRLDMIDPFALKVFPNSMPRAAQ